MAPEIDHVIVLVLENRSFDQLLGFHPSGNPEFDGLLHGGPYQNPGYQGGPPVAAEPTGKQVLPVDPDHAHDAVMLQLGLTGAGAGRTPTMAGFVDSYERKGRGLAAPAFEGLLAPIANWLHLGQSTGTTAPVSGRGPLVMRCLAPEHLPVLTELAASFGVCTRWFASVPGETWPNRNFLHAATSDGTTDIEPRFYANTTIFELLEQAGKRWHIYYDDTPQVWAFNKLWDEGRAANWYRSAEFATHVRSGRLPHYSFIEPNHRPPIHATPFVHVDGVHGHSNSQHPANNQVPDADYDAAPAAGPGDFERGESLVAEVYEALRANPGVFNRSVLLVAYDEHGGFYDHVPPPTGVPAPGGPLRPGLLGWLARWLLHRRAAAFDFTMLGVRVPALVVSPFVPAGSVDPTVRDHASVPATLRATFAPDQPPLTGRDRWAPPFLALLSRQEPRTDLPDLSGWVAREPAAAAAPPTAAPGQPEPPVPGYYRDLVELAALVDRELPGPTAPATLGPRARARHVTSEFQDHAETTRAAGGSVAGAP
jgi:phospholipase C